MRRWLILVMGLLPVQALADCESGSTQHRAEGRAVTVAFATQPARIKVGEFFSLDATLCPKAGASAVRAFKVDASMPDHKHGMNYQPSVVRKGDNAYTANGLMFHMPGRWQLVFEVDSAAGRERILADYQLD
ncbi:MAG: hypothetical protein D4R84_14490 [Rhodocyclaceae bacterium]|nr:MAG: hypothetical protein D4R84_14490 [Rhodocyclaceae bacterium]